MNDKKQNNSTGVPASMKQGQGLSSIWIIPIVAMLIGLYMVFSHWSNQGPLIEVRFESAEGIEAGKTKIKRKNVELGEVIEVQMSEDALYVILSVRIAKQYAGLLREDTVFWVVRPRIGKGGVSGLGTLLSGAYLELTPGSSAVASRKFEGLETPPVTPLGTAGVHVTLDSDSDHALHEGDPVIFHGREVGTIEYVHFNETKRRTYYNTFIRAPFDSLITSNTRFWFRSGYSVDLSAEGLRVETGPLASIISGGVAFEEPGNLPRGKPITERGFFTIYPNERATLETQYTHAVPYIILFDHSIRGLLSGAPVEYRGQKIGRVVRTDFENTGVGSLLDPGAFIPVLIELEPARLGYDDSNESMSVMDTEIEQLISTGLHAGLASGNLLTGSKYIELQYHEPDQSEALTFAEYTVIPSVEGQLGQLMVRVEQTLDKINSMPLTEVANSARTALNEVGMTLVELRKSAVQLEKILADPESHVMIRNLNQSLSSIQRLAEDFSAGSVTHQEIRRTLRSIEDALKQLEPVLNNVRRKPNSLIFGGLKQEKVEPKGAQ